MTDEEIRLMKEHGITCETKLVFHFQSHTYDRLDDALSYAQINGCSSTPTEDESPK